MHSLCGLVLQLFFIEILQKFLRSSDKLWIILVQAVYYGYLEVVKIVIEKLNKCFFIFKTDHPEVDNAFREMQLNSIQIMDCCCDILHDKVIHQWNSHDSNFTQSSIYRFL